MADMPNIARRRLQAGTKPEVHPDPDLMTAFVERSLSQREQSEILQHLAQCGECREVVALSLPEYPVAVPRSVPVRSAWLSWPVLRWGALAACVVVVGAAVTLHYRSTKTSPTAITVPSSDAAIAQSRPAVAHATLLPPSTPAFAKRRPTTSGRLQAGSKAAPLASQTAEAAGASTLVASAGPPAEGVQMVPGRAKDESEMSSAAKTGMSLAGGMPARQEMASSAMIARAATVPANVTPRWTLTSDGMLQRSLDSGKTWETILVASPGSFRALTADGFDIWVGGAKGALYHSIDAGQHWMKVQPVAAGTSLTADIIGIEFADLQHGTLTTADKQTWITADAGRTWQKQ